VYGADVRLPGMLAAVVAHPPVVFGTVDKLDAKRALAVPGVVQVIELPAPKPPINFQMLGGVAVVADTTWAAMRGRAALDVTWHGGDHGTHDSTAFTEQLLASVRAPQKPQVVRKIGDADAALAKAANKLEAEYVVPYLTHVAMEPPAAIARVDGTKCEVWACTQNPQGMQDEIAAALKLKKHDVTVHVTLLGGGFGRKSFPDFGVEAAVLAQKTGKPVRVQWTREDDVRNGTYHAISAHALAAGLDDHGKLVAWRHRLAFPSIRSTLEPGADLPADWEMAMGLSDLPLAIPNVKIEAAHTPAHVRIGWLRSVCNIQHAFATCSFIDELAHETKRDPRDMMLDVYGAPRVLTAATQGVKKLASNYGTPVAQIPFDTARLHGVIARVSQMAKWDSRGSRALGIAAHSSFGTWVAVACEVSKGPRGELRVDEAWIAADCGQVLNPDRVRYQMEGGFVFAMSNALHGKLDVKDGAITQRNFHDYRVLRMPEAPKAIHVELIDSALHPGGAGEPGVPPVAPAIANAWFTLTGVRMRSFPFMK
jgi:isoquinoline 1-oxidoreductase subunit beta